MENKQLLLGIALICSLALVFAILILTGFLN